MAAKQLLWGGYTIDGIVTIYIDGDSHEYRIDAAVIPKLEYRFTKDPWAVINTLKKDCLWWVGPDGVYHEKENTDGIT